MIWKIWRICCNWKNWAGTKLNLANDSCLYMFLYIVLRCLCFKTFLFSFFVGNAKWTERYYWQTCLSYWCLWIWTTSTVHSFYVSLKRHIHGIAYIAERIHLLRNRHMACQMLHYSIFLFDLLHCYCIFFFCIQSLFIAIAYFIFVFNICSCLLYVFRFCSILSHSFQYLFISIVHVSFLFYIGSFVFNN